MNTLYCLNLGVGVPLWCLSPPNLQVQFIQAQITVSWYSVKFGTYESVNITLIYKLWLGVSCERLAVLF